MREVAASRTAPGATGPGQVAMRWLPKGPVDRATADRLGWFCRYIGLMGEDA